MIGEEARIEGQSWAIASESRPVRVTSACCRPPRRRVAGSTLMTFVPRLANWLCTSMLALWPTETMVVTAAMPITTPSTVRPARILFLASARKAIRRVTGEIIAFGRERLPGAERRGLDADHEKVA